jgi:hypothetical protein
MLFHILFLLVLVAEAQALLVLGLAEAEAAEVFVKAELLTIHIQFHH